MGGGGSKWQGYSHQLESDKKEQSYQVPDSKEEKASNVIRNPRSKDGFGMYYKPADCKDDLNTGWKCFKRAAKKFAKEDCFGYRKFVKIEEKKSEDEDKKTVKLKMERSKFVFEKYEEVYKDIELIGNGIASLGLTPKTSIGLYSINRPEWMLSHLAGWSKSFRTSALYDTLGAAAVQYIIWHSEMEIIFVSKRNLPELIKGLDVLKSQIDSNEETKDDEERPTKLDLKYIVQFDYQQKYGNEHEQLDQQDVENVQQKFGVSLIGLTDLIKKGTDGVKDNLIDNDKYPEASSEDIAYIMYTSGTTGNPKGVILTQNAFACIVGSTIRGLEVTGEEFGLGDTHVSFLPLAHSFESALLMCLISIGARCAYFNGSIKHIADDWKEMKPTVLAGVPRIFAKTFDKIIAKVNATGGLKKTMFDSALDSSANNIRKGSRSGIYDALVWKKVAEQIGFEKMRFLASGAAPLAPYLSEFLKIVCVNAYVIQGYGLTESLAVSFFTQFNDLTLGHVGIPTDNTEFRLVDAEECGYRTTDKPLPRGEVQLRGPTIMQGYFKNKTKTDECLDSETGWFSTGDIGRLNYNGTLSIIDRRKNMFKIASGEYVASEKLEVIYEAVESISQIWIYGNSFKDFVVAVVVPDVMFIVKNILKEKKVWPDEMKLQPATKEYNDKFKELAEKHRQEIENFVKKQMKQLEKKTDLKKFEIVKDIHAEFEVDELLQGFNVGNNLQTPTFKKKRPQLKQRYLDVIKQMYTRNNAPPKENEDWEH